MPNRSRCRVLARTLAAALLATLFVAAPAVAADPVVVVRRGDTLSEIALRHGTTVRELAALNGIGNPNRIYAGQRIRLSSDTQPEITATASRVHVVARGETLTAIARRYGTTIAALAEANAIARPNRIYVGQRLLIPGGSAPLSPAAAPTATSPAASVEHRVRAGETLWGIAARYRTSVSALAQANGIARPSLIRVGQRLVVPVSSTANGARPAAGSAMPAMMRDRVASRAAIGRLIADEAARYEVPAGFALAVAWQESGWQQGVVSSAGAVGVMQLMPATADWVAATMLGEAVNLNDARSNVRAGVRLLRHYLDRYHGDRALALAAYYQGQRGTDLHGIYPMSRPYVASILAFEEIFRGW